MTARGDFPDCTLNNYILQKRRPGPAKDPDGVFMIVKGAGVKHSGKTERARGDRAGPIR